MYRRGVQVMWRLGGGICSLAKLLPVVALLALLLVYVALARSTRVGDTGLGVAGSAPLFSLIPRTRPPVAVRSARSSPSHMSSSLQPLARRPSPMVDNTEAGARLSSSTTTSTSSTSASSGSSMPAASLPKALHPQADSRLGPTGVTVAPATAAHASRHKQPQPRIPRIIHQTWKTAEVPSDCRESIASWKRLNTDHEYRFYTDADAKLHIATKHPQLMYAFERMKAIERADLFRYVILHDVGGVYADIDTVCSRPVSEWAAHAHVVPSPRFVVGFEMVTNRPDWRQWYANQFQLCQWTMAATPGHEILRRMLETIEGDYATFDSREKPVSVMFTTGPGLWSQVVQQYLKETYGVELGTGPYTFQHLADDYIGVGDEVLLLPMRAFAINSGGYSLKYTAGHVAADIFARHTFLGSWK